MNYKFRVVYYIKPLILNYINKLWEYFESENRIIREHFNYAPQWRNSTMLRGLKKDQLTNANFNEGWNWPSLKLMMIINPQWLNVRKCYSIYHDRQKKVIKEFEDSWSEIRLTDKIINSTHGSYKYNTISWPTLRHSSSG